MIPADSAQTIGIISDTHGLLREEALRALAGVDLILHAGDVGRPDILETLRSIAPVAAVRGNIDTAEWASALPATLELSAGPARIYMLHNIHELDLDPVAAGYHVVVSGHSHQPGSTSRGGVLYVNPGSAGPRRFRLPVTVALLDLTVTPCRVQRVDLAV